MVASIYWRCLAEVTVAIGNIKCCSATDHIRMQSPDCWGTSRHLVQLQCTITDYTQISHKYLYFRKKKQLQLDQLSDEKSWFSKRINVRYQWPAQLHRQVGLTFLPLQAETDCHTISWCPLPALPSPQAMARDWTLRHRRPTWKPCIDFK